MAPEKRVTRVDMAKRVAKSWLAKMAVPEYRIVAYSESEQLRKLSKLLKGFRDSKIRIAGLSKIPDLGIKVEFDKIVLSSKDKKALEDVDKWLTAKGCESSGVK